MKIERDKGLTADELEKKAQELLKESEYTIEGYGLYHKSYDKEGNETHELLSDGIPVIIENAEIHDGEDTAQEILLQCLIDGKAYAPEEVTRKDFERLFQDGKLPIEFRPNSAPKTRFYITDCIRSQVRELPTRTYYTQTGFIRRGEKLYYLYPGGAVTADGFTGEILGTADGSEKMGRYALTGERAPDRWKTYRLFVDEAYPHKYSYPVMAFVALAPLCDLWEREGHDPAFVMNLYGTTGCGKSTLAAIALSFYGNFSRNALPGSFHDTKATTEQYVYKLKDALYVVDNGRPSESQQDRAELTRAMSDLVTMYGDKDTKGRSWVDSGRLKAQKTHPARGLCMITAEEIPNITTSNKARLFNVEMTPPEDEGKKTRPLIDRMQENRGHLNQIMTEYIQWLLPRYDTLAPSLSERFRTLSGEISMKHGRLIEAVAHLQIAFMLWTEFLHDTGQMSEEEKERADDEAFEIFCEAGERHGELITEDSPPEMFCSAIRELLASGAVRLDKVNQKPNRYGSTLIGWEDEKYVYLQNKTAVDEANDLLKGAGKAQLTATNRFLKMCAEGGYIASWGNANTHQKRVRDDLNIKVVWFFKDKLLSEKEDAKE